MVAYPSLTVELPSDARAARAARQSIRSLEPYVEQDVVEDVNLLVSELVTNSVRYGTVRSKKGICLDARPTAHGIRVEIRNVGGAMLANRLPHNPSPESGWGLV
ncbi:MAG: ATP-binding protein, partial [Actinomycetota bacterium]